MSAKRVEDLVKMLGIQVENMCNFLPQDKVVEFTRLNANSRLRETQKAVGREDLIELQVPYIYTYSIPKPVGSVLGGPSHCSILSPPTVC